MSSVSSEGSCFRSDISSSTQGFVKIPRGNNFIVNESIVHLSIYFPRSCVERRKYFQPRDRELYLIASTLFADPHAAPSQRATNLLTFATVGLGGSGKTELAYKFINTYKDKFDAIFFLVADSTFRLSEQFTKLAIELGLVDESERSNQERCREVVKLWLSNPVKATPKLDKPSNDNFERVRWLLVFDNADNPNDLDLFWPHAGYGSVLITSRSPLARCRYLNPTGALELESLPLQDATSLLKYLTGDDRGDDKEINEAAEIIVKRLQNLPLAIDQIGTIIVNQHLSIVRFLNIYSQKSDYYKLYSERHLHQEYEHSLASVWAFESLQPNTFAVLSVLAMLDPEKIDEDLLDPGKCKPRLRGFPKSTPEYHTHLSRLINTSMIEKDRNSGRVRVHRLVQDVARANMAKQTGTLSEAFNDAFYRIASQWPYLNRKYVIGTSGVVDRWSKCDAVFSHILFLSNIYKELMSTNIGGLESVEFAELVLEAAQWRMECGSGHEATPLIDQVEAIYNKLEISANPRQYGQLYRARVLLACDYGHGQDCLRHAKLEIEQEQVRADREGGLTGELAISNNNMAMAYAYCGEYSKAIPFLQMSIEIRQKLPGFKRFNLYSPLVHLGVVYNYLGRNDEAVEILTTALEDRQRELGPDDRVSLRTASIFYALGNVRFSQREFNLSLALHQEALKRSHDIVGPTNRGTLNCMFQVARVQIALGHQSVARELLNDILCNSLNLSHYSREIARAAFLYAHCCETEGNKGEAIQWRMKSVDMYNRLLPNRFRTVETIRESDVFDLVVYDNINC